MNLTDVATKHSALFKVSTAIFASKSFLVSSLASLVGADGPQPFYWFLRLLKRARHILLLFGFRCNWSDHTLLKWRLRKVHSQLGNQFLWPGSAVFLIWILVGQSRLNSGGRELVDRCRVGRCSTQCVRLWGWSCVGEIKKITIRPKKCRKCLNVVFLGWEWRASNFLAPQTMMEWVKT